MNDFTFTTTEPLNSNTDILLYFLNHLFLKVFNEKSFIILWEGSYAEVLDSDNQRWEVHASGDGDFTHHRITFIKFKEG
jgi:hypothetical protein